MSYWHGWCTGREVAKRPRHSYVTESYIFAFWDNFFRIVKYLFHWDCFSETLVENKFLPWCWVPQPQQQNWGQAAGAERTQDTEVGGWVSGWETEIWRKLWTSLLVRVPLSFSLPFHHNLNLLQAGVWQSFLGFCLYLLKHKNRNRNFHLPSPLWHAGIKNSAPCWWTRQRKTHCRSHYRLCTLCIHSYGEPWIMPTSMTVPHPGACWEKALRSSVFASKVRQQELSWRSQRLLHLSRVSIQT